MTAPAPESDAGAAGGADGHPVVTAVLRSRERVLLLQRSDAVAEFPGRWAFVSGSMETDDPEREARREIAEETGLADAVTRVRTGRTLTVTDDGRTWAVTPMLFDCDREAVSLNPESDAAEWVHPTAVLRRKTVPDAWRAYEAVAPSVASITGDAAHGAATLSRRALAVLRDRAGRLATRGNDGWDELTDLARRLRSARPGMAPIANRIDRAMAVAAGLADGSATGAIESPRSAAAVETAAIAGIERAWIADRRAASRLADRIDGETVLTVSRSGTVERALRRGDPAAVYVAASAPGGEGIDLAEALAGTARVTVHTDAAVAHLLATADIDRVAVGCDAILPDGRCVNKTGTRAAAIAAMHEGVPVTVAASTDKLRHDDGVQIEHGPSSAVYDGDAPIDVCNPTFDVTPADHVEVLTERGQLDAADLGELADDLAALSAWAE